MGKHIWSRAVTLFLYMGFIFFLSSIPGREIPPVFSPFDKVIHFFLYLTLGLAFTYFLSGLKSGLTQIIMGFITFFFVAAYGLSDEIHQRFTPGRNFEIMDMVADVIGGVTGWLVFQFLCSIRNGLPKAGSAMK